MLIGSICGGDGDVFGGGSGSGDAGGWLMMGDAAPAGEKGTVAVGGTASASASAPPVPASASSRRPMGPAATEAAPGSSRQVRPSEGPAEAASRLAQQSSPGAGSRASRHPAAGLPAALLSPRTAGPRETLGRTREAGSAQWGGMPHLQQPSWMPGATAAAGHPHPSQDVINAMQTFHGLVAAPPGALQTAWQHQAFQGAGLPMVQATWQQQHQHALMPMPMLQMGQQPIGPAGSHWPILPWVQDMAGEAGSALVFQQAVGVKAAAGGGAVGLPPPVLPGERGPVGGERGPVGGERGPADGERGPVGGERGPVGGERGPAGGETHNVILLLQRMGRDLRDGILLCKVREQNS